MDNCHRGCGRRSVYCFLMRDESNGEPYNYRLDLCPECAKVFKDNPDSNWEGIWDKIDYQIANQ